MYEPGDIEMEINDEQTLIQPLDLVSTHEHLVSCDDIYTDELCPVSPGGVLYSDLDAMKAMLRLVSLFEDNLMRSTRFFY